MTVAECRARMSSAEFTYWLALFRIEAEEAAAAAKKGLRSTMD